ncbi:killer toxin [Panaeolus papilionaceus]|nr:killer toxin [Panaeolus papilionaceus]
MQFASIVQLAALLATMGATVQAIGINCQGSGRCGEASTTASNDLNRFIQNIPDDKWFNNGQQIACVATKSGSRDGICAFLQNTGGTNGKKIKELAPYIPGHGCSRCGSVPYYFPEGNNDVKDGALTFNFVTSPCNAPGGNGLC